MVSESRTQASKDFWSHPVVTPCCAPLWHEHTLHRWSYADKRQLHGRTGWEVTRSGNTWAYVRVLSPFMYKRYVRGLEFDKIIPNLPNSFHRKQRVMKDTIEINLLFHSDHQTFWSLRRRPSMRSGYLPCTRLLWQQRDENEWSAQLATPRQVLSLQSGSSLPFSLNILFDMNSRGRFWWIGSWLGQIDSEIRGCAWWMPSCFIHK